MPCQVLHRGTQIGIHDHFDDLNIFMMLKTVSRHISFCHWVSDSKWGLRPICYGRTINGLMAKDNMSVNYHFSSSSPDFNI